MTDTNSKKPVKVLTDTKAGPYIDLPVSLLDDVRKLLDHGGISYRVHEYAISLNGSPETTIIFLGRNVDPVAVKAILDSAA